MASTISTLQTRILQDISEQADKISYGTPSTSHSSVNAVGIYGVSPTDSWLAAEVTADGKLKCDTTIDTAGLATDTNQSTMISSLSTIAGDTTSLDTKIVACNTGSVTITSSALPTGAASESSLSSLNGKVTSCNTGAVVISSGSVTETNSSSISSSLTSIDGKVSSGSDATLSDAQQVLAYGRDASGNVDALKVDASGHLEVIVDDVGSSVVIPSVKSASTGTQSVTTTASGTDTSSTVDMDGFSRLTFIGSVTNSTDPIELQGSIDGTNWFAIENYYASFGTSSPYPWHINVPESALRYFRLSRTDTTASAQTWEIRTSRR